MLYPLVANPNFILKIKDNNDYYIRFVEFYKKYKDVWTDIFILIDDDKDTLLKSYKDIYNSQISQENPEIRIILEFLFKLKKYKYSNIQINEEIDINSISKYLKDKGVRKIVEFPKYFEEEFINLKKLQPKINLYNSNYEDVLDEICSITRFAKKVFLNDAMIPYMISNLQSISDLRDLSNEPRNFNYIEKQNHKYYQQGFKHLIKNIFETNFYQNELEIYIYTTLHHSKIKKIYKYCCHNYSTELDELWDNLKYNIIESIKKCISSELDESAKCVKDIIIKQHFKDGIKKIDGVNFEIYDRSIFVLDFNLAIEIRKGIDLFDEQTENKLRADSGYYIRNYLDEKELENARQILDHPEYKPKKLNVGKNFN